MPEPTGTTPPPGIQPFGRVSGNGLAVAGLVCGMVGMALFSVILGPLAVIFGGIGLVRAADGRPHRGMAIAAVVLGVLDLVVFAAQVVLIVRHGSLPAPRAG
jgi:hypothetical protein